LHEWTRIDKKVKGKREKVNGQGKGEFKIKSAKCKGAIQNSKLQHGKQVG
jgi:hypothetical protein